MTKNNIPNISCSICNKEMHYKEASRGTMHSEAINNLIKKEHPNWDQNNPLCFKCLNHFRGEYIKQTIEEEKGELTDLEVQVINSLKEQELISQNLNSEFSEQTTFGQRLADKIAEFGGSWSFILSFFTLLAVWILYNVLIGDKNFDPYPFILLNLILSCLAALQAPVIMMSQNRQEAKDRLRSEHDYKVNLKAELEIRHLNLKMDQLMTHQWQRLLEIQEIQTQLMQELANKKS